MPVKNKVCNLDVVLNINKLAPVLSQSEQAFGARYSVGKTAHGGGRSCTCDNCPCECDCDENGCSCDEHCKCECDCKMNGGGDNKLSPEDVVIFSKNRRKRLHKGSKDNCNIKFTKAINNITMSTPPTVKQLKKAENILKQLIDSNCSSLITKFSKKMNKEMQHGGGKCTCDDCPCDCDCDENGCSCGDHCKCECRCQMTGGGYFLNVGPKLVGGLPEVVAVFESHPPKYSPKGASEYPKPSFLSNQKGGAYNFIVNPETGRRVKLNGAIGKKVLRNYLISQNGGAASVFDPNMLNREFGCRQPSWGPNCV